MGKRAVKAARVVGRNGGWKRKSEMEREEKNLTERNVIFAAVIRGDSNRRCQQTFRPCGMRADAACFLGCTEHNAAAVETEKLTDLYAEKSRD